ncbi:MAG: non-homologous end-joining DNA ligase [Methanoregulaceae archaeon]|nr:non-homologous end-joining DNA ligase [Methanoregulaceae archaeon]
MRSRSYRPMLAVDAEGPFSSDDWTFEVKWDGIRAISYVDREVSVRTRNDNEVIGKFPELATLSDLAPGTVLDGEIVTMDRGRPDIQQLFERLQKVRSIDLEYISRQSPVTYVVFDILEVSGKTVIDLPIEERRKILAGAVKEGPNVVIARFVPGRGEDYYKAAVAAGLEGIMAKKNGSRYEPGVRSGNWQKIKEVKTCDCVVFGYTGGNGRRSGSFGALILGLFDNENPVYIGKAGTGFSDADLEKFSTLFSDLETGASPLPGVERPDEVTWLRPEMVVEIGYHSVTKEGRLRMPRFIRVRSDKSPEESTIAQIRPEPIHEYREKRDFRVTPEPPGSGTGSGTKRIFVVQEHHARRLHYDLRLEHEGVLKSWAVPKGVPEEPGEKRLAVETEDHPIEYGSFEGTIPAGEYGAGTVSIWDKGLYEVMEWTEKTIEVVLAGKRLKGRYVLVRFRRAGMNQWLLFKAPE